MVDVKTIEKRENEISDLEKKIINTSYIEYGKAVNQAGSYDKVDEKQISEIIDKNKKAYMGVVKPTTVYSTAMANQAFGNILSEIKEIFNERKSPQFLPKLAINLSKAVSTQLNSYKLVDVKDPKKFAKSIEDTYHIDLDMAAVNAENIGAIYEQARNIYRSQETINTSKKALGPRSR